MTDLEKQSLETFLLLRDYFAPGIPLRRRVQMDVMEFIGDMIGKLNNTAFGCATGLHRGRCTCKPAKLGKCIRR